MSVKIDIKNGRIVAVYTAIAEAVKRSRLSYLLFPRGCGLMTYPDEIVLFLGEALPENKSAEDVALCLAFCTIPAKIIRREDNDPSLIVVKINPNIFLVPQLQDKIVALFEKISDETNLNFDLTDSLRIGYHVVPLLEELDPRHDGAVFKSESMPPISS